MRRSLISMYRAYFAAILMLCAPGGFTASAPRYLPSVQSQADFVALSRVHKAGQKVGLTALPHVLFVIDRKDNNKIYYVNTREYEFHQYFVNAMYLSLDRDETFLRKNYLDEHRRFILGTIAWQPAISRWTFEMWEGDLLSAALIQLSYETVNATFFAPVAFKPNSTLQDVNSVQLQIKRVLQSEIAKNTEYQALNIAKAVGRVRILPKIDDQVSLGEDEILILNEVPIQITPVSGVIVTQASTPLSHVNILAKGWGIPNAFVKDADKEFASLAGQWVQLTVGADAFKLELASEKAIKRKLASLAKARDRPTAPFDLQTAALAELSELRKSESVRYGGKAANLGEVMRIKSRQFEVPKGFAIPFHYYDQFVKENKLDASIASVLADPALLNDAAYRRKRLSELRAAFLAGTLNADLRHQVLQRLNDEYKGVGVFVRSSSNSEDLPNFNGAGLYSSVPNAKTPQQVVDGIKTVWASLWNFEAFEARRAYGISHFEIFMGALIQTGVNSESSGVMVTADPFDRRNAGVVYIAAKRGLGVRVVEGQKVAEQLLFDPFSKAIKVLTRSEEDALVTFDAQGGVRELKIDAGREVLTDDTARRLAMAATQIEKRFGGKTQDIEWAVMNGAIYIVQSRPFIDRK